MEYNRIKHIENRLTAVEGNDSAIGALTALTDSSGAATGNDTLAALVADHTITDSTAGTPSTTALTALTSGSVYATDVASIRNNFATLAAEIVLLKAKLSTMANNTSDTAAKINAIIEAAS